MTFLLKHLDAFLNNITMYRLMLNGLFALAGIAILFAALGWISYSPVHMIASFLILTVASHFSNMLFGKLTRAAVNFESVYITALLLFFVLDPNVSSLYHISMLALAAIIAQASKYVFAIGRRHMFNPVAISAVILGLLGVTSVLWWIATPTLLPFVLVLGLMVVRKIRRFEEVGAFALAAIAVGMLKGIPVLSLFLSWPLVFFGMLMLTEPRTAPALKREQIMFGVIVGALFTSLLDFGFITMTPELALVLGNIFAFCTSPREVVRLKFKSMTCETEQVCDFAFTPDKKLHFQPGQYLEWTLPLKTPDSRGNRRYFTIASAPSDEEVHLGVRLDRAHASAFKKQLLELKQGDDLVASHLAGEFTTPKDPSQKMVWIAGGIGVTPFRSMIRELAKTGGTRDVHLFYCANTESDFAYKNEFTEWCSKIGVCTSYVVGKPSPTWTGMSGYLTREVIEKEAPDYLTRLFYFSGPPMMVENYVKLVKSMGVPKKQIKTDYFPGF
ncbi:hypothetical protein A3C09_02795 [Candidatus Uhrbacteria bacterium RIFCSPHIGHO2_02_FULL_47_44]|uniref:FAD-binding FR-type domain-containing protein n=1 Tax=Candidatus Uhrbacteria bacterium RIFCSPLOWO2_02_FULL_48_18 TaxID=1802408 RepID=A0A1F7V8M5_9BACT|nr:MAG: hypothetical protein A2839_01445 [Candidatus Uhrbacteria bacterium RIFCSPHIGHO2_01_FULL_47_10]OGL70225.1 MAG: hypothetical protein A3C09_02795 [Candidatus Uhrbacteria bacterium RIFCSPHIGHO2_02_FULL_47_44]OGL77247.1 MAG: hypothetical protein A3E97_01090 [Candidatus Uhrbacteria bacterium RIFCSPHIGHO2_12_FULL_47_12]OGL80474.1 MAG: hypothetical protein A3B20_03640 [Candidatus Uhrbacteria bacterium RIFCSPLOWO2_01_FULL_47_17]OGL86334.1 MAG: hypothetical protein A3I41_02120 [Candidatus Uhrbact